MDFRLPELGEGVFEGELVKWRVKAGDEVTHDQPICDVMTDKATMEIPAPFDGKITALKAKEGEIIKVEQVLLTYEGEGHATTAHHAPQKEATAPAATASASGGSSRPETSVAASVSAARNDFSPATRVLAAPVTRRVAREMGVDLASVHGSGPHGRVMKEDVLSATGASSSTSRTAPSRAVAPGTGEKRVPVRGLRKKIAEKMRLSKDKAAHFTYVEEADATELVRLRQQAKEIGAERGIKVTFLPFVMKAMVAALRQYPILNSSYDEETGELVYKYFYNIGLSIQTDDGLTAPVVKDVEHKNILELSKDIQGIVDRARNKQLTLDDFKDGTITLTNAGSIGGLFATPIINYPEVAIVGLNKIFKKPVVQTINGKDEIVIRDWTYFSISLDHRVVDGAIAAEFMKLMIRYIENPSLMLLESF